MHGLAILCFFKKTATTAVIAGKKKKFSDRSDHGNHSLSDRSDRYDHMESRLCCDKSMKRFATS